ncbi:MAG: hypothetical protein AAF739_16110 [Pseudomonadota bacterium]
MPAQLWRPTALLEKVQASARNNAELCETVLQAHGVSCGRGNLVLEAGGEPPPYFPALVTLQPDVRGAVSAHIRKRLKKGAHLPAIKDSFGDTAYTSLGMSVLFEASWIWRESVEARFPANWRIVRDHDELAAWHTAWRKGGSPTDETVYPAALLSEPKLHFIACWNGSEIEAGCLLSHSEDVVGLSNFFCVSDTDAAFADASQVASALYPSLPIAGYEAGEMLAASTSAGFTALHRLRVLVAR